MSVRKQIYKPYFEMGINEKINFRQYRNSLNINHLFATGISSYKKSEDSEKTKFPKVNNGIYHHIGKNHSKYPKN